MHSTPVLSSVGVTVVLFVPGGLSSLSTSLMTSTNEPAKETKTEKLGPLAHSLLSCDILLTEDQKFKACGCSPFLWWVPNGPTHTHIPPRPQRKSAAWCCGHRREKQSEEWGQGLVPETELAGTVSQGEWGKPRSCNYHSLLENVLVCWWLEGALLLVPTILQSRIYCAQYHSVL